MTYVCKFAGNSVASKVELYVHIEIASVTSATPVALTLLYCTVVGCMCSLCLWQGDIVSEPRLPDLSLGKARMRVISPF